MDQSLALNALAPYLALAKSATSPRAAADLITQATSAANTYIFAELLQQPNIQALKGHGDYGAFYELLCVFSWGTWETYTATSSLPPLSDVQKLKLRLLSLLTIAAEKPLLSSTPTATNLSYATLSARLGLASSIDLEHLVTQAIYSNLITATLNPSTQTVMIASVSPLRDLAPGSVTAMIAELDAWSLRCTSVLAGLDAEIAKVKADAARRAAREQRAERQIAAVTAGMNAGGEKGGVLGVSRGGHNTRGKGRKEGRNWGEDDEDDDEDGMDLDGGDGGGRKQSGGSGGSGSGPGGALGRFLRGASGR